MLVPAATPGRRACNLPAGDAAGSGSSRVRVFQATNPGHRPGRPHLRNARYRACRLESGMDARLSQMANDAISGARIQLETQVDVVLKELGSRNAKELGIQLDDACGKLKTVQKGIETSVSELVRTISPLPCCPSGKPWTRWQRIPWDGGASRSPRIWIQWPRFWADSLGWKDRPRARKKTNGTNLQATRKSARYPKRISVNFIVFFRMGCSQARRVNPEIGT